MRRFSNRRIRKPHGIAVILAAAALQGRSWHEGLGCPARERLAQLTVPYLDFSGRPRTRQMIVARSVAGDVLSAFADIKRSGFRIRQMRLIHEFGGDDDRSMAAKKHQQLQLPQVFRQQSPFRPFLWQGHRHQPGAKSLRLAAWDPASLGRSL